MGSKKVIDSETVMLAVLSIAKAVVFVVILLMFWYGITLAFTLHAGWIDVLNKQLSYCSQLQDKIGGLHGEDRLSTSTGITICECEYEVDSKICCKCSKSCE